MTETILDTVAPVVEEEAKPRRRTRSRTPKEGPALVVEDDGKEEAVSTGGQQDDGTPLEVAAAPEEAGAPSEPVPAPSTPERPTPLKARARRVMRRRRPGASGVPEAEGYLGEVIDLSAEPWKDLIAARQNRQILQVKATAVETHDGVECLVCYFGHIKGLIPAPEAMLPDSAHTLRLTTLLGKTIAVRVMATDQKANLVALSRKAALEEMAERTLKTLREGQVRTATIRTVLQHGAIADIGGVTAWLPAREIDHGWVEDARQRLRPGQSYEVLVQKIEDPDEGREGRRITVSLKALRKDPWEDIGERYQQGAIYAATVVRIMDFGVFVRLEPGIEALCKHPLGGDPPVDAQVIARVTYIDREKRRVGASIIRRAD